MIKLCGYTLIATKKMGNMESLESVIIGFVRNYDKKQSVDPFILMEAGLSVPNKLPTETTQRQHEYENV